MAGTPKQQATGEAALHGRPIAFPGMTVGLLGGSFDPPHAGHVHITRQALAAFGLHRVWWLVSPGNPLKSEGPAALTRRVRAARAVIDHPRVDVTDIEARLGTRYTAQTLRALKARFPGLRFVWLMGADNLAQFHRWENWQEILRMVPVGVLPRPGAQLAAGLSPAARAFSAARLPASGAAALANAAPPAWVLVHGAMRDISSSAIRARGDWQR